MPVQVGIEESKEAHTVELAAQTPVLHLTGLSGLLHALTIAKQEELSNAQLPSGHKKGNIVGQRLSVETSEAR